MKKRILAFVLALATVSSLLTMFAVAVPYTPSANAWKDFSQEHNYVYEVTKGNYAPSIDGKITEKDGYGEPIAKYGYRYTTTAEKYKDTLDNGEYKLRDDGSYYVYPKQDTDPAIWSSISAVQGDNPFGYITVGLAPVDSYSSSVAYYFYSPLNDNYMRAYFVTKENFGNCYAMNKNGYYYLSSATRLDVGEPVDWETNYMDYYTYVSTGVYKPVEPTADGKAPTFTTKKYYYGDRILLTKMYRKYSAGNSGYVGYPSRLKALRVTLPEEVNLYARYDDKYLYYAIEVHEPEHEYAPYRNYNYYGTTMSNSPGVFSTAFDYSNYYRKGLDKDAKATSGMGAASTIRTYINTSTQVNSTAYILNKFGGTGAVYNEVQVSGVDYQITHTPAPKKAETPAEDNSSDEFGGDMFGSEDSAVTEDKITGNGLKESLRSGTYGVTVYEYRVPWILVNGKYNPETSTTPVPEMFTINQSITLDNIAGPTTNLLSLNIPKYASNNREYDESYFLLRFSDGTGLTEGEDYGTYNFRWKSICDSTMWDREAYTTDYFSVSSKKIVSVSEFPPVFFTAGQEPRTGYVQPEYAGANIRVDNAEEQAIRIKISVPKIESEKEIAQVGAIVAPTEVVRTTQLKLGMSSVKYYAYETPVLYGLVNGEWMNLAEHADKYLASASTPNDSDSFISYEEYGGKPSGIYNVHTLAADLENPYQEKSDKTIYTVVYAGPSGKGIYNDFDDFNTFYTIRPYIKYKDGTVTYGEHEYKSIYYIACNLIQPMLTDYNVTVVGSTSVSKAYNMDSMPLSTIKDDDGNVYVDRNGNPIYLPVTETSTTYSPHAGAAEYSIYLDYRRFEVFRWYAIRSVGRNNANTPLRADEYDTFDPNTKLLVKQYEDMYNNIWSVIRAAETNRYIALK